MSEFEARLRSVDQTVLTPLVRRALANDTLEADPAEWNYWKREVLAYQSGLLDTLPGDFTVPGCFAVSEYPGNQFWIWLEDIAEAGESVWPIERYGLAARHLGQLR